MAGTLYLCATPIGNLEDMTFRAVRTLKEADLIAAEDTRNSIKLLNHFEIRTPMTSYRVQQDREGEKADRPSPGGEKYRPDHGRGHTGHLGSRRRACKNVP